MLTSVNTPATISLDGGASEAALRQHRNDELSISIKARRRAVRR
jgi:hypothetical protein